MHPTSSLQSQLQALSEHSFDWSNLHSCFPFSDDWSEGEYEQLLAAALASITSLEAKMDLLAMLDLQYAVLLEQLSVQQIRNEEAGTELVQPIFGERVMAYLELNSGFRSKLEFSDRRSARSALLEIPQGQLWHKLFK